MAPPTSTMIVPEHSIAHHWIKQTLVPFLLFAFASTLPYPADISNQIQSAIDFCLAKPDHPSDGDDLVFERIFMAIMHRHKYLAPDLEMVVDHLEPLAKYLIRRAQIKGPFELLERTDLGSDAWVEHEQRRLGNLTLKPYEAKHELRSPARLPTVPTKAPLTANEIDPRLVYAQPGQFAAEGISGQLTSSEHAYYRRQNRELEQYRLRRQQQPEHISTIPTQTSMSPYLPGRGSTTASNTYGVPYLQPQQQPAPASVHLQQSRQPQALPLRQTTPTPKGVPQMQTLQPPLALDILPRSMSGHPYLAERYPAPQSQPFQHPSAQYQPARHQSSHNHDTHHQPTQRPPHPAQPPTPAPYPTLPQVPSLPSQTCPVPIQPPDNIASSDFAHLRGADWSNAVQQRAHDIVSKISVYERDILAQDIMQRQHTIAQAPPPLMPTATTYSPSPPRQDTPVRPQSTMAYSNVSGPRMSNISTSASYSQQPLNQHLAHMRQPQPTPSSMSHTNVQLHGPLTTRLAGVPRGELAQQTQLPLLGVDSAQPDALQQLQHAAYSRPGSVTQACPYGGQPMSSLRVGEAGSESEDRDDVRMEGV